MNQKENVKPAYELIHPTKRESVFLEDVEVIRYELRNKENFLFLDYQRCEVFFDKKYIPDFQGINFDFLYYFLINFGFGADKEKIFESMWNDYTQSVDPDKISQRVHTAISRFRMILKRHGILNVVTRAKGIFSSSKIYVLEPMPEYAILQKIENDMEL